MKAKVVGALSKHFTEKEQAEIKAFLDRGFSEGGEIVITSIFIYAKENKISVARVMKECEKEWERNWKYQHPDIKGSADAPGGAGRQNRASLENIYAALGIPSPIEAKKAAIPAGPCVVRTHNSTYRFGKADAQGNRNVTRDGRPLNFQRCIIEELAIGDCMVLDHYTGDDNRWVTSGVTSIE